MTRLRIDVVRSGGVVRSYEPDGDLVRIGRSEACDVRVEGPSISPEHALILVRDDGVFLEDLGSGTTALWRDNQRAAVAQPHERLDLRDGDVVHIGEHDDMAAAELRVAFLSEQEPPRVVEVRPIADLVAGPAAGPSDSILRTISELQRRIGSAEDLSSALNAVADAALVLIPGATHATLVLRDDTAGSGEEAAYVPVLTRVRGPDGLGAMPTDAVRVARSVFRKVVQQRAAVLAADAPSGELSSESLLGASIRSTIGVPLFRKDEMLGVLQIDNRAAPGMFTSGDVERLGVLAANASLAVANARLIHKLELVEEQLQRENSFLKGRERSRRGGALEIVGQSRAIKDLTNQIGKVADTRVSVLIEGETGSGKELVASALHYRSRRRDRLFVAQNCAALPENLLESELFGHKRGAFTGATEDRKGLFEIADGGTLFLDEVTEMPLALQAKLLRVLQESEVRPLGASTARHVDARIVAATNRNIEQEVKGGRFREDLYYRLKVFPLRVPSLKERREDVPLLAGHFLSRYSTEIGKPVAGFTQPVLEMLAAYDWPGNVRELENEVQRLVIQVDPDGFVTPELLSPKIRKVEGTMTDAAVSRGNLREMMDQVERHLVTEALREHGNNKTNAAKALGITREGLHKKLKQLGIG